jgi:hypothetical protein
MMSFKHLRMLNSASKCLKITHKIIKFSKPENWFPKKTQVGGYIPWVNWGGGGLSPSGGNAAHTEKSISNVKLKIWTVRTTLVLYSGIKKTQILILTIYSVLRWNHPPSCQKLPFQNNPDMGTENKQPLFYFTRFSLSLMLTKTHFPPKIGRHMCNPDLPERRSREQQNHRSQDVSKRKHLHLHECLQLLYPHNHNICERNWTKIWTPTHLELPQFDVTSHQERYLWTKTDKLLLKIIEFECFERSVCLRKESHTYNANQITNCWKSMRSTFLDRCMINADTCIQDL